MTKFTERIKPTLQTLTEFGFFSSEPIKIKIISALNTKNRFPTRFRRMTFKNKNYGIYVHFFLTYENALVEKSKVTGVNILINNQTEPTQDHESKWEELPENEDLIKAIMNKIERTKKEKEIKLDAEKLTLNRLPIVTEELKSIFGDNANIYPLNESKSSIEVEYRDIKLQYSIYTTIDDKDLDLYTSSMDLNSHQTKIVTARQAKRIIDILNQ